MDKIHIIAFGGDLDAPEVKTFIFPDEEAITAEEEFAVENAQEEYDNRFIDSVVIPDEYVDGIIEKLKWV